MPNVELSAEISKNLVVELLAIVGNDGMRESLPVDYRLSEETSDFAFSDVHEKFSSIHVV